MPYDFSSEDNVVKNMAREVVRECAQSGVNITADAATYLIHLKFLLPGSGFKEGKPMGRSVTQTIVLGCVSDFIRDSISINTIKLQSFSEMNAVEREVTKENLKESTAKRLKPLLTEIMEVDDLDKEMRDKMYKRIIVFTILFSGLGHPSVFSAFLEAQAALQSIFKITELDNFIALTQGDKEDQLMEFTRLVTGIRLFNKDCQKGGDSIEDLPLILTQASQKTRERILACLENQSRRLDKLIQGAKKVYDLVAKWNGLEENESAVVVPRGFTAADVDDLKKISCMVTEHANYLRKVLLVLEETDAGIAVLIGRFRETLLKLQELVRYRSAVPILQVFPLFIYVSYIWEDMQGEGAVLSEINEFVTNLNSIDKYADPTPLEEFLNSLDHSEPRPENIPSHVDPSFLTPKVRYIPRKDPELLDAARFGGYCAWTLAATNGLLVRGNPEVGFLQYEGFVYAFASAMVASVWGKDPDRFIKEVYRVSRKNLELIKILHLYHDLQMMRMDPLRSESEEEAKSTFSVQVQTEIHPVAPYTDQNYSFSVWELKRKAMQLSRIINYRTKSQQTTNHSHFRSSIGVQAKPNRTESTQTTRDNWCNHPTISSYLSGLRGRYEDAFQALDLTRPVDEDALPCRVFPAANAECG